MRGIAALIVLCGHYASLFPWVSDSPWLQRTPLYILLAGHEAVLFFFVLSGFVLSLPFLDGRRLPYMAFVTKRLFRLYPAYAVALLFALAARRATRHPWLRTVDPWFNIPWHTPLSHQGIVDHFLMLGSFPCGALDPVIWSLTQEMRISLLFPWLILVLALPDAALLGMGVVGSVIAFRFLWRWFPGENYVLTLHYAQFFLWGALLAKYRHQIGERVRHWGLYATLAALTVAWLTFSYRGWVFYDNHSETRAYFVEYFAALGSVLFIVCALGSQAVQGFLHWAPLRFFGRISYSLYLLQAPVLLATTYFLYPTLPLWAVVPLAFGSAVLLAWLSFRLVEKPFIGLGRKAVQQFLHAMPTGPERGAVHVPAEPGR